MGEPKKAPDICEKQLSVMKKQLAATRLLLVIMSIVMAVIIFEGAVLVPPLLGAVSEISEAAETINNDILPVISEFDADALNKAVANFDETINELDIESFNSAVAALDDTVSELNVDEFNTAVTGLSSAVEGISKIGSFFR